MAGRWFRWPSIDRQKQVFALLICLGFGPVLYYGIAAGQKVADAARWVWLAVTRDVRGTA